MIIRPFVLLFALGVAACGARGTPADLAIIGASVVDVAAGTVQAGRTVIVTSGRITAVTDSPGGYQPAVTVDGSERFVMPGLWDNHVHFGGGEVRVIEE